MGPVGLVGTLSPSDPAGILFPAVPAGKLFPVAPDCIGTLFPTDHAGMLFPAVLTEFPVLKDPVVTRLPADPTVFDARSVVDVAFVGGVRPAVPLWFMAVLWLPWLGLMQCTLVRRFRWIVTLMVTCGILGMISRQWTECLFIMVVILMTQTVEDPRDLAYEDWLDWYNFNALEGYGVDLPEKGDDQLPSDMGSAVMMVGAVALPAHVRPDLLVTSDPMMDIEITVPVVDIPITGNGTPVASESADPWNTFEIRKRMRVYYGGDLNDSDYKTSGDNDYDTADPWNNFETVHWMPVYYGGDLNDSDYEFTGDNNYDTWTWEY